MTSFDVGGLLAAAAADLRPAEFVRWDLPGGDSPAEQAATGYVMAVNLVLCTAALDCESAWEKRQKIYAAEIARLQVTDATARPGVVEHLERERLRGELNDRYRDDLTSIAVEGYQRVVELMTALDSDVQRIAATVNEINTLTQHLFDIDRPGGTVQDFLASRNLDTTIPGY